MAQLGIRLCTNLTRKSPRFLSRPRTFQPANLARTTNSPSTAFIRTMATSHFSNDDLKVEKLFDVSNVTAVVTGGGTGLGLMIAQVLQTHGAKVYIVGRREEALDNVVQQYSTGPGQIVAIQGDVSQKSECVRLASEIAAKEPKGITALINNAGVARDKNTGFTKNGQPDMSDADAISQHLLRSEPEHWDETFRINVTGQYFMSAAFIPLLAKGTKNSKYTMNSSIVNISSISGLMKGSSNGQFAYAASKAAFVHLTRSLATTLKEAGIRVNQVSFFPHANPPPHLSPLHI
jgi:NAD(P)-dependent dehydrogenase (short-subunit alcohol dehydrogenase family)